MAVAATVWVRVKRGGARVSFLIVRLVAMRAVVCSSLVTCLALSGCAHQQAASREDASAPAENNVEHLPLPPGKSGLPFLGETLAIADDMTGFLRSRHARYGRISVTHAAATRSALMSRRQGLRF